MQIRESRTAGEVATQLIREKILSGDLAPGATLNQNELASALDMSRIPIRDALRNLRAEGLILLRAHSTATVSPLSIADLRELFEIRVAMEPRLTRQALEHIGESDIGTLADRLETLNAADDTQWSGANDAFHKAIFRHAHRPRSMEIVERARNATARYLRLYHQLDRATDREEHRQIFEAVVSRHGRQLEALITAHISSGYETMLEYLAQPRGDEGTVSEGEASAIRQPLT